MMSLSDPSDLEPGTIGPRALTKQDIEKIRDEMQKLQTERDTLTRQIRDRTEMRGVEIKEAKRVVVECRRQAYGITETFAMRLAEQAREYESARRDDAARLANFVIQIASDSNRIRVLEKELAALQLAAKTPSPPAPLQTQAQAGESLPAFLVRLQLSAHQGVFEEEELDMELLRSMGRVDLEQNMKTIGLSAAETALIMVEIFLSSE